MNQTEAQNNEELNDDYLDELAGDGYVGIRAGDLAVPFLRVLQTNSPEVTPGDPAYVKEAKAGDFFNSLTHESFGPSIELVPLKSEPVWLEYTPKIGDKKGDFKGKHPVGSVPVVGNVFDGMKRTDNGNEIRETVVVYVLIKGRETELPLAFSATSTMVKHIKSWNSLIYTVRTPSGKQAAYFSSYWRLATALNSQDGNRWFNIGVKTANVERIGFVPKEVLLLAKKTRDMLDSDAVKADFAQITDGAEASVASAPIDTKEY